MSNFTQIDHPVLKHKLAILRNKETNSVDFRRMMNEIGKFLAYEASRGLETKSFEVKTPLQKTTAQRPVQYPMCVSILRAGNGLLDGVLETLPHASAGHIGIYRDKFIDNTVEYYFNLPDNCKGRDVYLIDPMLATADTAIASLDRLKQYDVGKITMLSVLVSPEAIERLKHFHPDVHIVGLSKEEGLSESGYLLPGMGDAGDRLYNTK